MSVITIWVENNRKVTKVTQDMIDRQIILHESPVDDVILKYTDEVLDPYGYKITKDDEMLSQRVKREPELIKDIKVMEKVANQEKAMKAQAKYSKDRSLTHGEKPMTVFTPISKVDPAELAALNEPKPK